MKILREKETCRENSLHFIGCCLLDKNTYGYRCRLILSGRRYLTDVTEEEYHQLQRLMNEGNLYQLHLMIMESR